MKKLKNCYLKYIGNNEYVILGIVEEDDRFETNHLIQTSPIMSIDFKNKIVKTETGSEYFISNFMSEFEMGDFIFRTRIHPEKVENDDIEKN